MDQQPTAIITRAEAKILGLKWYFTGHPCRNGHLSLKQTSNGECKECNHQRMIARAAAGFKQSYTDEQRKKHNKQTIDRHKEWRIANPELAKQKDKERREKDKEKILQRQKNWRQRNKERIREYGNQYKQLWRDENPEKARAKSRRARHVRRALEVNAPGKYTQDDIQKLLIDQKGLCIGCGEDILTNYEIDHNIPLSRGGTNWPYNLQLLCRSCNAQKNDKTMEEWYKERVC